MEPIDYTGALLRSWRLLLLLGVIGALVAVVLPTSPHKAKGSTGGSTWVATMVVGVAPQGGGSALNSSVTDGQILFYAQSTGVRSDALNDVNVDVNPYTLATLLNAHVAGTVGKGKKAGSLPTMLTGYSNSATGAAYLVEDYSTELGNELANVASQHQKANSNANVTPDSIGYTVIQPAVPVLVKSKAGKSSPTSSRKVRAVIGLGLGLLLAVLIVLARELLDKRIRSTERAESTFDFRVVAEIPGEPKSRRQPAARTLEVVGEPESVAAEAYRMLRMSVLFEALAPRIAQTNGLDLLLGNGLAGGNGNASAPALDALSSPAPRDVEHAAGPVGPRQVVLVVSPGAEATRPHVTANFAAVYAEAGQRAVVINTGELGVSRHLEPTGALLGDVTPADVESRLEPSRIENVYRLPLADFVENSGQLVTRAPAVIDAARHLADVVVVEAPPLLAVHHAEALSHAVDVVLVVGECWSTTFNDARRAGELLRRMEAPVLGVVLTNVRLSRRDIRQLHAAERQESSEVETEQTVDPAAHVVADYSAAGTATHTQA